MALETHGTNGVLAHMVDGPRRDFAVAAMAAVAGKVYPSGGGIVKRQKFLFAKELA
ncbi:MAG: hypothetical protein ACLFRZ_08440 [Rhodosalinus sp.]